jgi:glycine/D-amino acid oxidase-like deaminating enzyme
MDPVSPWLIKNGQPNFPKLSADAEADVVVVGGGIAGVTTAYELAKAGKRVVLLEEARVGEGVTGWTTAFITYATDTPLGRLEQLFGVKQAALAWETGRRAIDEIERIVREEKIDADFARCPAYIYGNSEEDLKRLSSLGNDMRAGGFAASLGKKGLGFVNAGYLCVKDQAKFHPVNYLTALAESAAEAGAMIFENTQATEYSHGSLIAVKTAKGEVRAKQLVLATHRPFQDPDDLAARLVSDQTYALEAILPPNTLAEGLYWDSQEPYHYFRVDRNGPKDRIILGGEDRPTGTGRSADRFTALENFLRELLPDVNFEFTKEWSGEILDTVDGLPFIGRSASDKNVFLASGFSGNGMTFGTASALIISDLILGRVNDAAKLFDPGRSSKLSSINDATI